MAKTQASKGSNVDSQHGFAQIPSQRLPRSAFNRSHGVKTTFDAGDLVPFYTDEALPGDTISLNVSTFARMATPLHPIMDNMHMDMFFFAVPIRLVWENWQKFMGEQDNPGDSTDFLVPQVVITGATKFTEGSLHDYFGLPVDVPNLSVNCLHHRAYALIWNEWFRSQDLQDSLSIDMGDGPEGPAAYKIQKRGKRHDYFTSCLPFPQKGPSVQLPLGEYAPVISDTFDGGQGLAFFAGSISGPINPLTPSYLDGDGSGSGNAAEWIPNTMDGVGYWDTGDPADINRGVGLVTDLSAATAATINQIRQAFQIQKLYERDARGGSRYTEILRSHFGVSSPDQRMQRPEYLGGGHALINVNPVPQTTETDQLTPQGNLAAFVTSMSSGHGFTKSFTEHCVIIGMINVRADLNYQQGLHKMWTRQTRFDYYWPSFAHLGEQAVLNQEIEAVGDATDLDVFGYQERYAEYRYKPSQITGKMRSVDAVSLDTWHLAQDFGGVAPLLNDDFIVDNPPIARVIAVVDEPHFLLDAHFQIKHVRPMPVYGVPGLVDHF